MFDQIQQQIADLQNRLAQVENKSISRFLDLDTKKQLTELVGGQYYFPNGYTISNLPLNAPVGSLAVIQGTNTIGTGTGSFTLNFFLYVMIDSVGWSKII